MRSVGAKGFVAPFSPLRNSFDPKHLRANSFQLANLKPFHSTRFCLKQENLFEKQPNNKKEAQQQNEKASAKSLQEGLERLEKIRNFKHSTAHMVTTSVKIGFLGGAIGSMIGIGGGNIAGS